MNKLLAVLLLAVSISASAEILPNAATTPGKVNPLATESSLCDKSFRTGSVRNVTSATRTKVFKLYNVKNHTGYCGYTAEGCEVDHLISLELGGTNDVENLWPQSYAPIPGMGPWSAHLKDALENRLHAMVCAGKIPLAQAQKEISTDWIGAYKKYVDPNAK